MVLAQAEAAVGSAAVDALFGFITDVSRGGPLVVFLKVRFLGRSQNPSVAMVLKSLAAPALPNHVISDRSNETSHPTFLKQINRHPKLPCV